MMTQNMYEIERIIQLDRLARDGQMRREWQSLAPQGTVRLPFARLAFVTYLLTLFRMS